MAETKAEDDDDEGFGDFKFASFPNQTTVRSDQINGRSSNATDDDEWGDFVEFPPRSDLSSGISHTQSPPISSEPSKPIYPFGLFPDQSTKPSQSMPTVSSRVESESTQWAKPKGALPLSLFGDVEDEEEQSDVVDPPVVDAKDSSADKHVGNVKNGSNIYLGGGINDIFANMYSQSQQIKTQNESNSNLNGTNSNPEGVYMNMNGLIMNLSGLNSNSDFVAGNKDFDVFTNLYNQSQKRKAENGLNSNSNELNSDINAAISNLSGLNSNPNGLNSDLYASFSNLRVLNSNSDGLDSNLTASTSNLSGLNSNLNGLNWDLKASTSNLRVFDSNFDGLNLNSDLVGGNEEFDGDDDGWEFKDAYSELEVEDGNPKVDRKEKENSEVTAYSFGFGNGSLGSIDLFAASNGLSSKSSEVDIGFDFKPLTVAQNGFSSNSYFKSEKNNDENGLNSDPVVRSADCDESFGGFKYAFPETGLKQEEEPKANDLSHSEVGVLRFDGKIQGNELKSENHKGALPLSIFGDEELEIDDSLDSQDVFMYKPAPSPRNGINYQGSKVSINDILSNLYSQAEQIPSVDSTQKPTENGFDPIGTVFDSNLVNGDDDFDDSAWEFKDASSQTSAKDETSLSPGDAHQNYSNKLKLDNYVDFYCRLKDELCFVATCHLDSLKKARSSAALSGEDVRVAALDVEIQEACEELRQENIISNEDYSEDHPPRDICLNKFLEVLNEPKFQVLESEYNLSRRLQLAEKDFRSAIELMKHATSILNVLTLGSMDEQSSYISTWSKMISVSAEELKHGAWIWKQSSEKNVQTRILSEPRGKQFIFALGEVYRVVAVIGASARLYKPWILSSSVDPTSIYALLEECYTLWSHSGLEEALRSISDPIDVEYDRKVKALLESIKYIHDLDALALGNHAFSQEEPKCRLSALPSGAVPDMKMAAWNGEQYFLTLANLWANLISCDPPELPCIHVGQ
uniref:Synergin gamma C-terminal domain-containing protein n=2 Tax=Davidia involucrata TaxID=16924 RepID=A0A5B6ZLA6_DAVIN